MLIGQKVTNIFVFRVVSFADVHTTAIDFLKKECCTVVYATILLVKMLLSTGSRRKHCQVLCIKFGYNGRN